MYEILRLSSAINGDDFCHVVFSFGGLVDITMGDNVLDPLILPGYEVAVIYI
ncbi:MULTISPECIES: hypothetical protein [Candidatus Ichthyocystis]|uniref:hypothetical protein n=1 Tax=Candidatus Ichthyocystis TaxID=2929841 RepID=UPI0012FE6C2E|nr:MULTISPECIES: hypothetical protein [Ichthyocystis]